MMLDSTHATPDIVPDPTPLKLRAVDLSDHQSIMIELADALRQLTSQTLYLRGVLADATSDRERVLQRALREAVDLHELAGRCEDTRERLAKRLRATGRL